MTVLRNRKRWMNSGVSRHRPAGCGLRYGTATGPPSRHAHTRYPVGVSRQLFPPFRFRHGTPWCGGPLSLGHDGLLEPTSICNPCQISNIKLVWAIIFSRNLTCANSYVVTIFILCDVLGGALKEDLRGRPKVLNLRYFHCGYTIDWLTVITSTLSFHP